MASVSVSHMILFIASIVIAGGVAGTLTDQVGRLSDAIDDQGLDVSEEVRTDIEIISDSGSSVYNDTTGNITLLVKNTGSKKLVANSQQIDVLINGTYRSNFQTTVVDGSDWDTNNVIEMVIHIGQLSSDDHRVKLIVNGDQEVFTFRS